MSTRQTNEHVGIMLQTRLALPREPEIVLEDMLYGLVRGRNHHVGRCEPDTILKPVNVKNLCGVIERVVQSVNGQLRALVNKLGIE